MYLEVKFLNYENENSKNHLPYNNHKLFRIFNKNSYNNEIINTDYKEYELAGKNIGIAQIETVDASELEKRKHEFLEVMEKMKTSRNLDLIIVLLTDVIKEGCLAFLVGDEIETVEKAFNNEIKDNQMYLPGVLSRKKQVVPVLEDLF